MTDWIQETLYSNGTLKNKLHITDAKELQNLEMNITAQKSYIFLDQQPKIERLYDLSIIHKFLFSDLYDWAGKYRKGNMYKGNTEFMEHERFDFATINIDKQLNRVKQIAKPTSKDYAELLDSINYMHPFREGNGRSTRLFLQALAANHGQFLDYSRHDKELIEAEHNADIDKLAQLITVENHKTEIDAFETIKKARYMKYKRMRDLDR
ncbi:Fic family protein [Lactobacillus mulieris]|uniref:protein adenylyltransferase n=1 Tax=Lactobacillus jensenii TaxID=109790 RepID=A0ABU9FFS4_LACJE|nr:MULTISPECIES: Fic family protein [Lactobacillus]MCW8072854.1 Fic family protein [Lactobacillus mulieris]MDK6268453.1 Fic family protein [Lactobacillus mulieris]MDT9544969.1 Fic family protein [Lactobacillus jensenii]